MTGPIASARSSTASTSTVCGCVRTFAAVLTLQALNDDLAKFVELVETTVDLDELDRCVVAVLTVLISQPQLRALVAPTCVLTAQVIRPEYDAEGLGKIRAKLDELKEDMDEEHKRVAEDLNMDLEGKSALHLEDDKTYGYSFRLTRKARSLDGRPY